MCAPCAARRRSGRRWWTVVFALGVGLVAAAAIAGARGAWDQLGVAPLERAVAEEPCNRDKVVALVGADLEAADNAAALAHADRFFAACGEWTRLRWLTYEARRRRSEWDLAAPRPRRSSTTTRGTPSRGFVREQAGEVDAAVADYRQAIALRPQLSSIPLNLAGLLEKQGKPCEALVPIEQLLYFHPDVTNAGELRARADGLARTGSCRPTGSARIRFDRGSGAS